MATQTTQKQEPIHMKYALENKVKAPNNQMIYTWKVVVKYDNKQLTVHYRVGNNSVQPSHELILLHLRDTCDYISQYPTPDSYFWAPENGHKTPGIIYPEYKEYIRILNSVIRVFGKSYNKVLNSLINEIRHLKTKARLI